MSGCTFPSYPLLNGDNDSSTPGAFFFRRKQNVSEIQFANKHNPPQLQSNRQTPGTFSETTTLAERDKRDEYEGAAAGEASYKRPKTPPQGSRSSPWSSYRSLRPDHPVFGLSKETRENLYAQDIEQISNKGCDGLKGLKKLSKIWGGS
ncbi:hypothetical protein Q7P37_009967 [Cladosporium fusiforme]